MPDINSYKEMILNGDEYLYFLTPLISCLIMLGLTSYIINEISKSDDMFISNAKEDEYKSYIYQLFGFTIGLIVIYFLSGILLKKEALRNEKNELSSYYIYFIFVYCLSIFIFIYSYIYTSSVIDRNATATAHTRNSIANKIQIPSISLGSLSLISLILLIFKGYGVRYKQI